MGAEVIHIGVGRRSSRDYRGSGGEGQKSYGFGGLEIMVGGGGGRGYETGYKLSSPFTVYRMFQKKKNYRKKNFIFD